MAASYVIIGEALVDVLPTGEVPGGSPANVAVTLGRLGRSPVLVTCLGDDARGEMVHRWLAASNVTVDSTKPITDRTSTAKVMLDEAGSASYKFDLSWTPDPGRTATAAASADLLHIGSIATVLEPGATMIEATLIAARERALVSFDPNARPAITPDLTDTRARVERLVALAHLVKVSDEDLAWYYPDMDPLAAARHWVTLGPELVVVTFGGDGAVALRATPKVALVEATSKTPDGGIPTGSITELRVPGVEVEVADSVGAGDTFMGALLDTLGTLGIYGADARKKLAALSDADVLAALTRSARAAAITVSRPGADPPTTAELDDQN
ncbi:MAG: carbohydrate kinase [Promicromonosporaceae bacterium]|nr:carbohydrate kinase [Promicromonosporaceae bacterium]